MRFGFALIALTLALPACDPSADPDGGASPGTDGGRLDTGMAPLDGGGADGGTPVLPAACVETPRIEPTRGVAYYFSDCRDGAAAACVVGDDANPGTSPDAPRRTTDGLDLAALPAGAQLLFARGGAWDGVRLAVRNRNATPEQPLVFGSYAPSWGGTARPWIRSSAGEGGAIEIGAWSPTTATPHGGYRLEGLRLDGTPGRDWGVWVRDGARDVTIIDCDVSGFAIGLHVAGSDEAPVTALSVLDTNVHHNSSMGMLGHAQGMLIEGSQFSFNNVSGSGLEHGIYLSGHGSRARIRNNVLAHNSVVGGRCTGGNFTMHGVWDDVLIEGNTILQSASDGGCYGFSLTPAYTTAESFTRLVVRGNTVVNLGNCAICVGSAPGIVVENNVIYDDQPTFHAGVLIPGIAPGEGDAADGGAVIRNNTIYRRSAGAGGGLWLTDAGTGLTVVSNLVHFRDGDGGSCFEVPEIGDFAVFSHNLCDGGRWSDSYATLAAAQAAGFDADGLDADPRFASAPSEANGWDVSLSPDSPARDAGHPTLSSASDRLCVGRDVPDIGATE